MSSAIMVNVNATKFFIIQTGRVYSELSSRPVGYWPPTGTISSDQIAIIGHENWVFLYKGSNDYYKSYVEDEKQLSGDSEAWVNYLTYWKNLFDLEGIKSGRVYSPPLGAFPLRGNVSEPCGIRDSIPRSLLRGSSLVSRRCLASHSKSN